MLVSLQESAGKNHVIVDEIREIFAINLIERTNKMQP
jgi:hypothetical protein